MVRLQWRSLARALMLSLLLVHLGLCQSNGVPVSGQQSGSEVVVKIVVPPSPPPAGFAPTPSPPHATVGDVMLSDVPAYSWVYGCSPTAAGMLAGYYARHSFPNLYTGPAGSVPLFNDPVWGAGECPFIASHQSIDTRTTHGHVDDYWGTPDPCIVHNWTPHVNDSLADFMGTSQDRDGNADGTTTFYSNTDGAPLVDYIPATGQDGCHGMRQYFTARGYTVTTNFTQAIYDPSTAPGGFTFAQYCAEIDAGNPVILQLIGHTMLGMGYNKTGQVVYTHTTWGNYVYPITWGGLFNGMAHWGVTVIHLALPTPTQVTATKGACVEGVYVTWHGLSAGVTGQNYYRVYRGTVATGDDRAPLSGWLTNTAYGDSSAQAGVVYYYWVTAASGSIGSQESPFSSADFGWRGAQPVPNSPPTLDPLPAQAVPENSGTHTLTLTGITPGPVTDSFQTVTLSAVSGNPALIPTPRITYVNTTAQGLLAFTPATGAFGTALITVTVKDNGGTANGGQDTISRTFLVTVNYVNDPPTLQAIPNQVMNENSSACLLALTGISAGDADDSRQTLTITAVSNNPALIPNPTVGYTSPQATGTLTFTPAANAYGSALITVVVKDNGGTANGGQDTTRVSFRVSVRPISAVVCWGAGTNSANQFPQYGQSHVPSSLPGVIAIAAGAYHTLALTVNGTVAAWGLNTYGESTVPAGLTGVTQVAAGFFHSLARTQKGSVICWGAGMTTTGNVPDYGQSIVPAGLSGVTAIAAGSYHSVALTQNGIVVCWGDDHFGQIDVPAGLSGVIAVAAGGMHTVALKQDGTVVCWGESANGQNNIPIGLTNIVAIAAGQLHTVALKQDGTVVCWGDNTYGQSAVPAGLAGVVAIEAGSLHTIAVKADGSVVCWGAGAVNTGQYPAFGQSLPPAGLTGVNAVSGGFLHTVALRALQPPTAITLTATQITTTRLSTPVAVGTFTTTDSGYTGAFTYTLVSGTGSADNASFTITGNTLYTVSTIGTKLSYAIRVRSTDQQSQWVEKAFTITVSGLNLQPDLAIRSNGATAYTGVGIFNSDGAGQRSSQNVASGATATYNFCVQNSGNVTDDFVLSSLPPTSGWHVQLLDLSTGADITTALTGTGWNIGPIASGAVKSYILYVTPSGVPVGSAFTMSIKAISLLDPTKLDVVQAITSVPFSYQPDLMIRNPADTAYLGVGLFNTDGAGQTQSQTVAVGATATYLYHLQNDGNTADSFTLISSAMPSGWHAVYYDVTSGANITTQMTGAAGWSISKVAPGAVILCYVQITPDNTVASGASATALISATSAANTTRKDAVKAVTIRQ